VNGGTREVCFTVNGGTNCLKFTVNGGTNKNNAKITGVCLYGGVF